MRAKRVDNELEGTYLNKIHLAWFYSSFGLIMCTHIRVRYVFVYKRCESPIWIKKEYVYLYLVRVKSSKLSIEHFEIYYMCI